MTDVTVRAEQAFEDWAAGEVRTVAHTPRISTLIADGRVTVLADSTPPAEDSAEAQVEDRAEAVQQASDAAAEAQADLISARADAAELLAEPEPSAPRARRSRTDKA
ncbi:hypothetical protein ACFXG4_08310 [Nocardia sp. NPDC059246]|uniref:hypothetical protein n=1 Tax=unclassified Nocardia TaxID=2637762 RepID=UPI003696B548